MKITAVSYRTNRAVPGQKFIHEHVELHAELGKGETPEKALEQLRAKTHELLFPETVNLRERLVRVSPLIAETLERLNDAELAELYAQRSALFEAFAEGRMAPTEFLRALGL